MKKIVIGSALVGSMLFAGGVIVPTEEPVVYTDRDTMIALKAGTLGVGADLSKKISDNTAVRVNVNGLTYSGDKTIEGIDYNADLTLFTAGVLADYYPSGSGFRISGGAYYNGNKLTGVARLAPGETITIGDNTYNSSEIGKVDAAIDFDPIAPYLGIGYTSTESESGWSFTLDAGVMYHGKANVSIAATINDATLANQIKDDVNKEIQQVKDKIEDYPLYPVIMVGVTYRF